MLVPMSMFADAQPQNATRFVLEEATISSIHAALSSRQITCAQLTRAYLDRIDAYDHKGPALNAILAVNPRALDTAAEMDRFDATALAGRPLHCIPVVLKDNYDTADMPTTGGSVTLAKSVPPADGFVVRRLREAGAIILAKANLMELAWSGTTVSSLGGQTRNPYDLTRTPGGSSGGTGAAIAANFGVLGTGTDTGQSIRSPASANSLVGVRPTRGLVSRAGIIPLSSTQDAAGPITRTVEDAAILLDALSEPSTRCREALEQGIEKLVIGIPRQYFFEDLHPEVAAAVERAIAQLTALVSGIGELNLAVDEDRTLQSAEAFAYHRERIAASPEVYQPETLRRIRSGERFTASEYQSALESLRQVRREMI